MAYEQNEIIRSYPKSEQHAQLYENLFYKKEHKGIQPQRRPKMRVDLDFYIKKDFTIRNPIPFK